MHFEIQSIELQMCLLLFVALGGYLLAMRMRQPAVVGQILLGVLIGPSLLGWISYSTFVSNVAHLGAIVLLFVIGLEFKLHELARPAYALIGLLGVAVPWVGGYFAARWFDFEPGRALIIGVALTATSIAITADTLRELGKLQTEPAKAIIGAAVIDDVLALLALAVATESVAGKLSVGEVGFILLKAVLFLAVGGFLGDRVITRFVYRLDEAAITRRYPEIVFVFTMMMAFLYAIAAEIAGLSAIVGAFLAGVTLEGVDLKYARSFREGADFLRIVFGAIFFVSLGVLVDVGALSYEIVLFLVVLTVVAVASKLIGCGAPARMLGMSGRDSLVVGFGMTPRGEVAMVVALIALDTGIIAQPVYVALVLMSLITTMIVPLILRNWLYRDEN